MVFKIQIYLEFSLEKPFVKDIPDQWFFAKNLKFPEKYVGGPFFGANITSDM
jgi:hypothetical protein